MKTVLITGSYDLVHIGHLRLLKFAKTLGRVCIATDTDERIRKLKGPTRPFNTLNDRIEFLYGLKDIDEVFSFNSDKELIQICENMSPDYRIVGSDHELNKVIGKEYCKEVIVFQRIPGYSTTAILENKKNDKS